MTGPGLLLLLLGLAAAWFLARPLRRALLDGLPPRRRLMMEAGLLAGIGVLLIAFRLAPLGVIALVLGGGRLAQALTGEQAPPGLEPGSADAPPRPRVGMDRAEALSVLGLEEGADEGAVEAAHRKMIARAHPDAGGSAYLAAKVNEARDVLRRGD